MSVVRTVLGDIAPNLIGVTNFHDHLFFRSYLLPGHELDDADLAAAEVRAFAAVGGSSIVQWTPRGLGRQRQLLVDISGATGVHIVSATGRHRAEHYHPAVPLDTADQLAASFVSDLLADVAPCGLIKIGTGYHHLDHVELASLDAAAVAHQATGAPIAVHLELGTGGDLVLNRLDDAGVPPASVVLGHPGRNPDIDALLALAEHGTYLCFDGPSRANHHTDWRTLTCIDTLIQHGHLSQLLIGGDTTTAAARSVTAGPGMPGLLTRFGASLQDKVGYEAFHAITVNNPARAISLRPTVADPRTEHAFNADVIDRDDA